MTSTLDLRGDKDKGFASIIPIKVEEAAVFVAHPLLLLALQTRHYVTCTYVPVGVILTPQNRELCMASCNVYTVHSTTVKRCTGAHVLELGPLHGNLSALTGGRTVNVNNRPHNKDHLSFASTTWHHRQPKKKKKIGKTQISVAGSDKFQNSISKS